jgi:hypothetical protein
MQNDTNVIHAVKWGVMIGVVYCLLVFLRYNQGDTNPIFFGLFAVVGYIVVLVLLLVSGFRRRKAMNGYIEMKDIFQSLFVTLLIFELFYAVFNFVYLKYVNPDFFRTLKDSTEALMLDQGMSQSKIDEQLEKMDPDAARKMDGSSVFISYLYSVAITGIFALIFALIIRKKKDPFNNQQDFLQAQQ